MYILQGCCEANIKIMCLILPIILSMNRAITDRYAASIDSTTSKIPMNTYEMITNKIIEKMMTGQVPWRKPWKFQPPRNLVSKRPYRGINLLLLTSNEFESPYYVTFHQAKQLGGSIKNQKRRTWYAGCFLEIVRDA